MPRPGHLAPFPGALRLEQRDGHAALPGLQVRELDGRLADGLLRRAVDDHHVHLLVPDVVGDKAADEVITTPWGFLFKWACYLFWSICGHRQP